MALSKQIVPINNLDSNDYDLIHKSGIDFEITGDGNYNSDVMKLTNFVVQIPQKKIEK